MWTGRHHVLEKLNIAVMSENFAVMSENQAE